MLEDILFATWFLLPAALSNSAPVFAAAMPVLKKFDAPIDGGRKVGNQDIFGPHKTWRGIVAGVVVATLVLWLQQLAAENFAWAQAFTGDVNYADLPVLILGPAFAIGALGGDAIKSFFKRRIGIESGKSWPPFDQLDYIVGSLLVSLFFVILSPAQYLWIFIIWFLVHLLASFVGYKLGLKQEPI